ncbi:unnamed protein product [Meloidogyne enterolobii]|uniref:Uncharacterized protein n=1 Tax=Meloidogyne enterolobii TaxID=390850 RepID=A0ACB0Z2M7_MELEN
MDNLTLPENNSSVQLLFSPHFSSNDFIFAEVDKNLVNYLLNGNEIYIRGYNSDEIVLCTKTETFCCKELEVSNFLLILEDTNALNEVDLSEELSISNNLNIMSVTNKFLETSRIRPNLTQKLKELFNDHKIELFTKDGCSANFGISLETILCCIQASEEELINKLGELLVIELEGKFYWISNEYIVKFIEKIAEAVDNAGKDEISYFSKDDLLQLIFLENIQMETIDWVLNNFCDKNGFWFNLYFLGVRPVTRIFSVPTWLRAC